MKLCNFLLLMVFVLLWGCSGEFDHVRGVVGDEKLADCIVNELKENDSTRLDSVTKLVCQDGVSDLTGLSDLSRLESLYIQGNMLENLDTMGSMPSLRHISIAGSKTLTSLSGIGGARGLVEVQANKTPELGDISAVSQLEEIEIFAAMMADIEDIAALSSLDRLKEVVVNYNSISDLSPLGDKEHLEHLQAYSNPIANLEGIEFNTSLKLFGVDEQLVDLCEEMKAIRESLADDAVVYGPDSCARPVDR